MSAVCVSIPGIFNVYNVHMHLVCVCYVLGFSVKKITTALANLSTVKEGLRRFQQQSFVFL